MQNEHPETGVELDEDAAAGVVRVEHTPDRDEVSLVELRQKLLANFAGAAFTPKVCDELLDFLAEEGALRGSRKVATVENHWQMLCARLLKILCYVIKRPNPTAIFAACYVQNVPMLDDLHGGMNQEQFAQTLVGRTTLAFRDDGSAYTKQLEQTKAAVNNGVKDAQKYFQLPPRDDQRTEEACKNMTASRVKQLAKA
jgi:hypothetical protein